MKKRKGQHLGETLSLWDGLKKRGQRRSGREGGEEQESALSQIQGGWGSVPKLQSVNKYADSAGRPRK